MANQWTPQQQTAIEKSGCNLLVAAAAGSGKTAVLVERIIQKITGDDGVDVDRLVVVTFTKAAAAEMKQRIREALDEKIEQQPDNERLIRQLTLLHHAQITTIDSFCLHIVRNYFTNIDLDPGFRTADEGEIKLLEHDVMEELLEDYYEEADNTFFDLVQIYGSKRDDEGLIDILMKLYRFSRSYPWPQEWLDSCLSMYDCEEPDKNPAILYLQDYVKRRFRDFDRVYTQLEEICAQPDGPYMYQKAVCADHSGIQIILQTDDFAEMIRKICLASFETLGRGSSKDVAEEKKEYVKGKRNEYKEFVNKTLKGKMFAKEWDDMLAQIQNNRAYVAMLLTLTQEFTQRMAAEKRERNIIDFNDMEHFALQVLVEKQGDTVVYTKASDELSEFYEEILIDEYQDSNMLQEVILQAVSRGKNDPAYNNIYMVGDVKQSIYKFRLACPTLFQEKYNTYESYANDVQANAMKIELQSNFRSRANVLECANDVFFRAMNPEFCGVEYNEKARLNPAFPYPAWEGAGKAFDKEPETCIWLIENSKKEDRNQTISATASAEEALDMSNRELEAAAIAKEIRRLVAPREDGSFYMVYDKKVEGNYRRITYSDIVVLTRTVSGWADTFVNVLMNQGIPAYSDAAEGYFSVREIKLLLNLLSVIDNPLQDIPMAAVMLSYFGGFDTNELAEIRSHFKEAYLYDAMQQIVKNIANVKDDVDMQQKSEEQAADMQAQTSEEPDIDTTWVSAALQGKLEHFLGKMEQFRKKAQLLTVLDLLWALMYDTGYYDYVGTMPAGGQRQANLDMLYTKAAGFTKSSYHGLFQFLRYIERLQKYEVDFAEASTLGENENLVRVMSIHKSKGLEFPVVFVAGMGKLLNLTDARGDVVIDTDLGIGTNEVNLNRRTKNATLLKAAVARKITQESISEELRVLYVAMTRAREKLYMTGTAANMETFEKGYQQAAEQLYSEPYYSYSYESQIKTYFDMVLPVIYLDAADKKGMFTVEKWTADTILESLGQKTDTPEPQHEVQEEMADEPMELPPYPHSTETTVKPKVTVSELKKMQYEADFEEQAFASEPLRQALEQEAQETQEERTVPAFLKETEEGLAGNARGTAYHRIMECLGCSVLEGTETVEAYIARLLQEEKITKQQADCITPKDIQIFLDSALGSRYLKALQEQTLHTEQPFVFIDTKDADNHGQLIQGVIDLYFEEPDGFVIVDYKTDRVKRGAAGEQELVRRYKLQLDYYAKALEQLLQKPVKEKLIYSFTLGKSIPL